MKRLYLSILAIIIIASTRAICATVAFNSGNTYYFYDSNHEIVFKGDNILEKRILLSKLPFDKESSGIIDGIQYTISDSDLSTFISNRADDINKANNIIVLYNGHPGDLVNTIKQMIDTGYDNFACTRFVQDIQLVGVGNLTENGIYKIIRGDSVSYIDYSDEDGIGFYENLLTTDGIISDIIDIKSYEEELSMKVSSSIYYINMLNYQVDGLVLLYQPFSISVVGDQESIYLSVEAGTTIPCRCNSYKTSTDTRFYLYFGELNDSAITDLYFKELRFLDSISNISMIDIDNKGMIIISASSLDSQYTYNLVDIIMYNSEDSEMHSSNELSSDLRRTIVFVIIILQMVLFGGSYLVIKLKEYENRERIEGKLDTPQKIMVRKQHKKYMKLLSYIMFFVIVLSILTLAIISNEFWRDIECGTIVFILGGVIMSSIIQNRKKKESFKISTLTLDDINLNDEYVLYLRGFRQDDYMYGKGDKYEFREEELFSAITIKSYAIGMTKELYSPMGAERVYFDDEDWKTGIKVLMQYSKFILIHIHNSENCIYEIEESIQYSRKTICIVTNIEDYNAVVKKVSSIYWPPINTSNIYFHLGDNDVNNYNAQALAVYLK